MDEKLLDVKLNQEQLLGIINTFLVGSLMMGKFCATPKDGGFYNISFEGKARDNDYTRQFLQKMKEAEKLR